MIKRGLIIFVCLLLLTAGAGGFLLYSQSGLQVASMLVERLSGGQVHIGAAVGKILGDWRLEKVTIHSDQFDVAIDELSCSWQPRQLLEKFFHIADLSVVGVELTLKNGADGASNEPAAAFIPADLTLPLTFLVGNLRLNQLTVRRLGGAELFGLDLFVARISGAAKRLDFNDISFSHSASGTRLRGTAAGSLRLSETWPIELSSDWQIEKSGCSDLHGTVVVSETLRDPTLALSIETPVAVTGAVRISELFGNMSYLGEFSGTSAALGSICDDWPEASFDIELKAGGTLEGLSGTLRSDVQVADVEMVSAGFDFRLDDQMLVIDNGLLDYADNQVMLNGGLKFDDEFNWSGVVIAESFNVSTLLPLPVTSIDTRIHLSGGFPDGNVVYNATVGEIEISVAEYDLLLEGGLAINGTMQGLEVTSCRFNCGGGAIDLAGSLNWTDGLQWETDIWLDSFDPSVIDILPQGRISGSLSSSGTYRDSRLIVETEIDSLTGELSGYELSGGGSLVYRDEVLTVSAFDITNGQNRISATGTVDDVFNLDFIINAAELERISPLLSGKLEITGSLQGPRRDAVVDIDLAGSRLTYEEYEIGSVAANIEGSLAERAIRGGVRLAGLRAGGFGAETVEIEVDGSAQKHRFSGLVEFDRGRLKAVGTGDFKQSGWQGRISEVGIEDQQFGSWQQSGSARLEVTAEHVAADGLCFSSGENRFCSQAAWDNSGAWSLDLDELFFSMDSLNHWELLDMPLSGTLRASMAMSGLDAIIESATASVAVDEVQLTVGPNEYYDEFVWLGTSLDFAVEDTNLKGWFSTSFIDGSRMSGTLDVEGAGNSANWNTNLPLQGEIDVDLSDLGFLHTLTSEFLLPTGRLSGRFALEGRVGAPRLAGNVDLEEGELRIPMLGVHLRDVNGTIEAGLSKLLLDLDSKTGDGVLHSVGAFEFGRDRWNGKFTLTGRNCQLLDRRAITLIADPDLDLALDDAGGMLSGKVFVPQALIEVEKIDRSASESSDVVFVDTREQATSWPFHYDIEVILGDDVQVTGLGLNGKLGGHLMVASNPDGITVGRGYLDIVDGSFAVYGSPLAITRGRLSFDGGPVDNPGLDIKASKMIEETRFGYDGVEAGVNITGSADDFEMDLYSIPHMEDSDILAYILLDRPISGEGTAGSEGLLNSAVEAIGLRRGSDLLSDVSSMLPVDDIRVEGSIDSQETTVVVGKKLSKDLSVSYDYNLFKNAGSFRVRYEFGKGFSVESRNSVESNAVELLYSLER